VGDRIQGRRDSQGDNWSWGPDGGGTRRPPGLPSFPWARAALIAAALILIGSGVALLALMDGDAENAATDGGTATATNPSSQGATTAAASDNSPTAETTPSPTTGVLDAAVFAWSRQNREWIEDSLPSGAGYREGETVPALVRIDGATVGSSYEVSVRYQCSTGEGAGLDFLASPADADSAALLVDPAAGRERADSTILVPDDPSITFDNGLSGRFFLWGGAFRQAVQGPFPSGNCEAEKEFTLAIFAAKETFSLLWAPHLATAADWGEGRGAASAGGPLTLEVAVAGFGELALGIAENAIEP
jgi:hypothetical protein